MSAVAIEKWLFERVEHTIQRHAVVWKWCDLALVLVRVPTNRSHRPHAAEGGIEAQEV